VLKGRYLVSTLSFFQRATKETHDLATKFVAKKPEHVRNCEGWASLDRKRLGARTDAKCVKLIRGVFDKETRRKPLAFAADAVSYGN
jgi:hypothetical protein